MIAGQVQLALGLAVLVVAFGGGVLVGQRLAPASAVEVPRVVVVTPAPGPTGSPPVAAATTASRARVVIERPVIPPGWGPTPRRPPDGPGPAVGPTPLPGDPATWPMERIIIEATGDAAATAPVVTPPPPVVVAVAGPTATADPGLPVGVTAGTFPGAVALDWRLIELRPAELVPLPGLAGVRLGASVLVNHRMAGAGGNLGLSTLHPRLYCGVGAFQAYGLPIAPQPWAGVGLRF